MRTAPCAGGRLVFHVFAALAEFIRELIVEGTHEGLAAARARGRRLGRPPAMTPEQIRHARALLAQPDAAIASIARLLDVSRATSYEYVPELKTGQRPPTRAWRPDRSRRAAHRLTATIPTLPLAGASGVLGPDAGRPGGRQRGLQPW
ncbi:recombinase family protein [Actinomadura miaoliensis]|uniref:Resolvase/invertase-type recombinase catalytic domain-containing protein n=1 Tax=Actinomadura miaoliensis TaxID=430685 RepID=A0ABP7UXK2_9ACTN